MAQKPKLKDVIGDLVDGENLARALDFIVYLNNNKINIQGTNTNTWKAVKKGIAVCYIKAGVIHETGTATITKFIDNYGTEKGSWVILPHFTALTESSRITADDKTIVKNDDYEKIIANQNLFDIVCSKLRSCSNCGNKSKCAPGINVDFWGKRLNNRCKFIGFPFLDPTPEELECIKILINIFCERNNLQ